MNLFAYGSSVLILPNPQFGESKTVNVKTSFDHAMDGSIYSFRYTPASDKFNLPFKGVMLGKKNEVVTFLKASAGQIINYTDQSDVSFNVRIISDSVIFTYSGKGYNDTEMYDFNLTLEKV